MSGALMLADRPQCGQRCVLFIDEFPPLAGLKTEGRRAVGGSIIRAARTLSGEYERTVLDVSGSIPRTIRDAASSHSAPLYRQLSSMKIGPLGEDGVREFVSEYGGCVAAVDGGVERLRAASGGLPYSLQVIGRVIGHTGREWLDAGLADRAVDGVISKEGRVNFEAYVAAMRPAEIRVARGMVERGGECRPCDVAGALGGGSGMDKATALLSGMLAKVVVEREGAGRYRLVDPLFGAWLASE